MCGVKFKSCDQFVEQYSYALRGMSAAEVVTEWYRSNEHHFTVLTLSLTSSPPSTRSNHALSNVPLVTPVGPEPCYAATGRRALVDSGHSEGGCPGPARSSALPPGWYALVLEQRSP